MVEKIVYLRSANKTVIFMIFAPTLSIPSYRE